MSGMDGFGRALRQRASEIGLSDAEVARRARLDEGRYGNYVRDAREPDFATLLRISQVLATTPNALLGITDTPPTNYPCAVAALNALDDDGRGLAVALLDAMVAHQHQRTK
ncbi:MAG: helix-turn-helix domain-containing protein [Candidatus Methylumidiphilus sp.]